MVKPKLLDQVLEAVRSGISAIEPRKPTWTGSGDLSFFIKSDILMT